MHLKPNGCPYISRTNGEHLPKAALRLTLSTSSPHPEALTDAGRPAWMHLNERSADRDFGATMLQFWSVWNNSSSKLDCSLLLAKVSQWPQQFDTEINCSLGLYIAVALDMNFSAVVSQC